VRWQKSGSFGFAKRWFVCQAKPNVPLVRGLFLSVFFRCFCLFSIGGNVSSSQNPNVSQKGSQSMGLAQILALFFGQTADLKFLA